MACGSDGESDNESGATFTNRYLWKVGNCEAGTLTPVDSDTGEAVLCGGNAREIEDCIDDKLFKLVFEGDVATVYTSDGRVGERLRFERKLECAREPALSTETCQRWFDALASNDDLYVERNLDRPPAEQLHADGLWLLTDRPWPGVAACADADLR
jgi:hypothetical protein